MLLLRSPTPIHAKLHLQVMATWSTRHVYMDKTVCCTVRGQFRVVMEWRDGCANDTTEVQRFVGEGA